MRTFNNLQIFTNQLTNSGQLDLRYPRITGNNSVVNLDGGIRIGGMNVPPYQNYPGYSGDIAWNQTHFYICLSGDGSAGFWARLSLENWI